MGGLPKIENLIELWGICPLCGEGFEDAKCVTREHLIPSSILKASKKRKTDIQGIIAPVHSICNTYRSNHSLILTIKELKAIKDFLGVIVFRKWINDYPSKNSQRIPIRIYIQAGYNTRRAIKVNEIAATIYNMNRKMESE